jgi:hypothetical protein
MSPAALRACWHDVHSRIRGPVHQHVPVDGALAAVLAPGLVTETRPLERPEQARDPATHFVGLRALPREGAAPAQDAVAEDELGHRADVERLRFLDLGLVPARPLPGSESSEASATRAARTRSRSWPGENRNENGQHRPLSPHHWTWNRSPSC